MWRKVARGEGKVWVKLFFLHPRLQGVPGFLRGGGVALLSYVSFGALMSAFLALRSDISDLRETLWYFLVAGTAMFGMPLLLIGAVTGLIADKRIRPVAPGAHHRRGNIPGTRPHRQT